MTEIRQSVKTGDIAAGGAVTVAPTIYLSEDEPQRGWRQALLRGPIEALGLQQKVSAAVEHSEANEHTPAAALLEEVAQALEAGGYPPSADVYREQAAVAFQLAGDTARSTELLVRVAQARVDRGDEAAVAAIQRLTQLDPALDARLVHALHGVNDPFGTDPDLLVSAVEAATGRDDHAWWAARAVEQLCLTGEFSTAIEPSEQVRQRLMLGGGERLLLELDYLQAVEHERGVEVAESIWLPLMQWARDVSARAPSDRGLCWQRRGAALARRDDLAGASAAFAEAARAWSEVPDHQEQAAAAMFSNRQAHFLLGEPLADDAGVSRVAADLRGRIETSSTQAERFTHRGLHQRIDGKLRSAAGALFRALRAYRRAGDLCGELEVLHLLGELFERISEAPGGGPDDQIAALDLRIQARDIKDVKRLAPEVPVEALVGVLRLDGARWERAASYAAVAPRARELPLSVDALVADSVLRHAERQLDAVWGDDPIRLARRAALRMLFVSDPDLQKRVLALAHRTLAEGILDDREAALTTLRWATETGMADHAECLLEDYLAEVPSGAIALHTAVGLAEERPTMAERLRSAAADDESRPALAALVAADLVGDDEALIELAETVVDGAIGVETHSENDTVRRANMVDLTSDGLIGRCVDRERRAALARKLVAIAGDDTDMRETRISACHALHNLAPAVEPDVAQECFDALEPIGYGQHGDSQWDHEHEASQHPLSAMRVFTSPTHGLRAAALQTLGSLASRSETLPSRLVPVAHAALMIPVADVQRAAMAALIDHPTLPMPAHLPQPAEDTPGRRAAAAALGVARHGMPDGPVLDQMLDDHVAVRLQLLVAAAKHSDGKPVLQRLAAGDPDSYLRARAQRALTSTS